MIPTFRRIIVRRAASRRERGPLIYSGAFVKHPLARAVDDARLVEWCVLFWFWVPPGKREPWRGKSLVPDIKPFERQALACGELEEVKLFYSFRADTRTSEATAWLRAEYDRRVILRLGFLPWESGAVQESIDERVQADEHARLSGNIR